jgi:hypothetical protein
MWREVLLETNPWLLGTLLRFESFQSGLIFYCINLAAITGIVSVLHALFDFLAFKNDIQVKLCSLLCCVI